MHTVESLLITARLIQDSWSSYERTALVSLRPFLLEEPFDRLDARVSTYRMTEPSQTPAIERERYFVWLCEGIVWTIGEIRAGRTRDVRRAQIALAKRYGRVEAYNSVLPHDRNCWIHAALADAVSAVTMFGME